MAEGVSNGNTSPVVPPGNAAGPIDVQKMIDGLKAELDRRFEGVSKKFEELKPKDAPAPIPAVDPAKGTTVDAASVQKMMAQAIAYGAAVATLPEPAQKWLQEQQAAKGLSYETLAMLAEGIKTAVPASPAGQQGASPQIPGRSASPPGPGGPSHPRTVTELQALIKADPAAWNRLKADPTFKVSDLINK